MFEFLEGAKFVGFQTNCMKDDLCSKTFVRRRTNIRLGGGEIANIDQNLSAFQCTSAIAENAKQKLNKIVWVMNGTKKS